MTETPVWRPKYNPWLIAAAVMVATVIEVLDTTVANVSLNSIAGNLSADTHEATWVLTSYLVSNAIVLPATAWFGSFFGRKRFLMSCIMIFTGASVLCGLANSLGLLIFFRVLQGAGGGALMPISQAILLESFPKEKRTMAMAVFSMGVVVAPIIGPLLGGWITVNYSWRYIFLVNLPIGILALLMVQKFIEEPPYLKRIRSGIDYIGFALMAVGLGLIQVILDKGQELDWFENSWICWMTAVSTVSLMTFVWWELKVKNPVVDLKIFRNRNFTSGSIVIMIIGMVLYSIATLLPLFFQNLIGYNAYYGGLAIAPRGMGAFLGAILVGRLGNKFDSRIFYVGGLLIMVVSVFNISNVNLNTSTSSIFWSVFCNGFGMSSAFVPLMTISMGTLNNNEMGNATGVFNLMRNIGGGVGIALTQTLLVRMGQVHQSFLASHLTPYDPIYQHAVKSMGIAAIYQGLLNQASLLSYVDCLDLFAFLTLLCIPFVFLFQKPKSKAAVMAH